MFDGTKEAGTHEISRDAVTPVGRWLRRFRIDELPQLWNIVRGEMNFVGPRPCLATQLDVIEARRKRGVFAAPPGITGLAQVECVDMSTPEKLAEVDADYVYNRSLKLGASIVWRTISAVVFNRLPG